MFFFFKTSLENSFHPASQDTVNLGNDTSLQGSTKMEEHDYFENLSCK